MKPEYLPGSRPEFCQWAEHNRKSNAMAPETQLVEALFEDAIDKRDIEWVTLETGDHVFSFEGCCALLGLDASAVRPRLVAQFNQPLPHRERKYKRRPVLAVDVPGRTYTHAYAQCPDGMLCSRCKECRARYQHWHKKAVRAETMPSMQGEECA